MITNIKLSIFSVLTSASLILLSGCGKWTEPQSMNFRHQTVDKENPKQYAAYLNSLREYKQSKHKLMFVTMNGSAMHPSSQSQHLMAMPDSADYICVKVGEKLNETVASEIKTVREKKGTKSLLFIDYAPIDEAWKLSEDAKSDKGLPAGTTEELKAFFKEKTEKQLAKSLEYGFDGIMVSFIGNTSNQYATTSHVAYMEAVKKFSKSHSELILVFRGSVRNVIDIDFLEKFKYITIVAGDERQLTSLMGRILGSSAPQDRVIMELSVPSADEPVQKGMSPEEGAKWVLSEENNDEYKILGLGISNAQDDYFNKNGVFDNIRKAIRVMNPLGK